MCDRPSTVAQRQRMKGLATWRVANRTLREAAREAVLWLLSFQGVIFFTFISNTTEDMRNFQSFSGRKRGHTSNSHHVFPSLPSVGRNAPGKACTSSIGLGLTLVPYSEETWKYGQLYLKSQISKSWCFTPKRKE